MALPRLFRARTLDPQHPLRATFDYVSRDERRDTERHRAWFPVRVEAGGAERTALAQNVSSTGVLIASRKPFEIGSTVRLVLHVDPGQGQPRVLGGRVVRCAPNRRDPGGLWPYKTAVAFDDEDPELVASVLATG